MNQGMYESMMEQYQIMVKVLKEIAEYLKTMTEQSRYVELSSIEQTSNSDGSIPTDNSEADALVDSYVQRKKWENTGKHTQSISGNLMGNSISLTDVLPEGVTVEIEPDTSKNLAEVNTEEVESAKGIVTINKDKPAKKTKVTK